MTQGPEERGAAAERPGTDRRAERREAALRHIVGEAWALSAEHGLTGWTLRDLGAAVGMRAPSLTDAGVRGPAELDLWTAMLIGLATQQISNDPGGDRWTRLVDTGGDRVLPAAPTTGG